MADESFWIEMEYRSLKEEMFSHAGAKESAIRFYIPAAAAVYGVPYVLKQTQDQFLWAVCAAVAGLLLLAMVRSLFVSAAAIRRLGAYIKEHIEPRTGGAMRWQHTVYALDEKASYFGHSFTVAGIALIANVVAAVAADLVFGGRDMIGWAGLAAILTSIAAIPSLRLIASPNELRRRYSTAIQEIMHSVNVPPTNVTPAGVSTSSSSSELERKVVTG